MLLSGLIAVGAGALAYLAVREQWVHLTVTQEQTDVLEGVVVQLTLRGQAALIGTIGTALAVALTAFGVVWCFYGLQRGWTMPGISNPALALLVASAGIGATVFSAVVWYVWEDAMVLHAKATDLSIGAMRELLDRQPNPFVQIERLSGLMRFGGMMVLGFCAACLAWWAYRKRS